MKTLFLKPSFAALLFIMFGGGTQTAIAELATTHTLGGTVTGLATGNSVVLRNVNGSEVRVTRNGSFTFGSFSEGAAYAVTVKTHPSYPAGNCAVMSGTGTITDADVAVVVNCLPLPQVTALKAEVSVLHARTIQTLWTTPGVPTPAVAELNIYVSTRSDCDFSSDTFTGCPGEKLRSVHPGSEITEFGRQRLKNGQDYFVQVETVFANGAKGLSRLARARPNELAFNNTVRAMTTAPNGTVYLGGNFDGVGVATGSAVPLNSSTGKLTTQGFPAVAGTVNVIVDDGVGGWYLGGQFTHVGGLPHRNLTHILANGSVDTRWRMFPDGPVHALEHFGRVLYVGGSFNSIVGATTRNLAGILLLPGSLSLASWNPNPNNTVRALKVFGNALYIGGDFIAGTGGRPGFLAAFPVNDQGPLSSQPLPFDMHLDGPVRALAADRDQALYVGGSFKTFGDLTRVNLAKLVWVGGTLMVSDFHPDPGIGDGSSLPNTRVNALVVAENGNRIYVGGSFHTIRVHENGGIAPLFCLAAMSATGVVSNWEPNPFLAVEALAVEPDSTAVYVGGSFTQIGRSGARIRFHLAKFLATSDSPVAEFETNPGTTVRALAVAGGTLYAGGDFNFVDRLQRRSLAAIGADGSLLPWNPDVDGPVYALVHHNNRFHGPLVYAGGSFRAFDVVPRSNLAAFGAVSGELTALDNFLGTTDGPVKALALLENSDALYVGGLFTSIAGWPADNLAKLFLFNGTPDLDFKPQPTGSISALIATTDAVRGRDVVYVGGNFTSIRKNASTPNRTHLAKIDANSGTALNEFVVNPNLPVTTLALSSDPHAIYVGGVFDRINGTLIGTPGVGGLAAVEIDGSPLLTGCSTCFNPGPDGGTPMALATFSLGFGERVFAGGNFPNIGGGPISNFAALTGYSYGAPTGFSSGSFVFPNGTVSALAISGNKVYIGGAFSGFYGSVNGSFNGDVRGNFSVVDATTGDLIH
jgi:hypothetical protein